MITLDQAKTLTFRAEIHDNTYKNSDGTCQRWRINGSIKRWKRTPDKIQIPIKRGLYEFYYLDNSNLNRFHLAENCPRDQEEFNESEELEDNGIPHGAI